MVAAQAVPLNYRDYTRKHDFRIMPVYQGKIKIGHGLFARCESGPQIHEPTVVGEGNDDPKCRLYLKDKYSPETEFKSENP
jgi:hypothetical protein